jgi:very-short-patch-repair endonuclease
MPSTIQGRLTSTGPGKRVLAQTRPFLFGEMMNTIENRFWDAMFKTAKEGIVLQYHYGCSKVVLDISFIEGGRDSYYYGDSCLSLLVNLKTFKEENIVIAVKEFEVGIIPQFSIGGYIADFYIHALPDECKYKEWVSCEMAVEIDGHDFHEKTKEQASYDKRRDRYFLTEGTPTVRYTGTDVHVNPQGMARDALETYIRYYFKTLISHIPNRNKYILGVTIEGQIYG